MPYKSDAQRRFMHAQHPEIASKWDAEIRSKKKGKVSKMSVKGEGWLKPVIAGTVAGGLANQFPRVQDIERQHRRKKKARIKKMQVTSTDPEFNQAAAQKAFDLVMKMDLDSAEMFTHIVAADMFESTIEKNLGSLQRALNTVFEKRVEVFKTALLRAARDTNDPRAVEYAKALDQVEEFTKVKNQYYYGAQFEESDIRRDPGTGRFMVKVKQTMTKPIKDKAQAEAIIGSHGHKDMNDDQRAKYQDEYRQVANFLSGVANVGPGNVDVVYHLKDNAGHTFSASDNTGKVPKAMLEDPDTTLVAIEAKPTTLTAGGAAYGLAGGLSGEQVDRVNRVFSDKSDQGFNQLANQWASAGTEELQTSRTFNRLQASGSFMNMAAPPGSNAQLAGKFAQMVGQYGPEAERVMGPAARKTAYRYRGVEKTPDTGLVRAYGREVQDAKRNGVTEPEADEMLLFGTAYQPKRGDFVGPQRTASGARERKGIDRTPAIHQMGQRRAGEGELAARAPTWAEQTVGATVVARYLQTKLPDKHLYRLHLASGNTPPSEGVIINREGQLAAQAVGYGDDHYLPFNLKNLKSLKGGEYIRNRSVGGPSTEDVYAGLMGGARRLTVVSRSGTFQVEFEPDLRGGRRHSDQARRMTRRYEQILDAVQSGQVDRQNIPKRWRAAIEQEVKEEYGDAPRQTIRDETDARIKEFKEDPKIEGRDLDRAEAMISQMEARAGMGEVSEKDVADFRRGVMNELHNMKEVRFRLNGIGYEAALKSLQEQFPYYIKDVRTNPTKDEELLEYELDEGYVEPGRNRPTKARAGLFGTKENPGKKFSASHADYQRGRTGKGAFKQTEAAAAAEPGKDVSSTEPSARAAEQQKIKDAYAEQQKVQSAKKATLALREVAVAGQPDFGDKNPPMWWTMDDAAFKDWVAKPENATEFHSFMQQNAPTWGKPGNIPNFGAAWVNYEAARGMTQQVKFQPGNAGHFPRVPYTFDEKTAAYHAGAREGEVTSEMARIDRGEAAFTSKKPLSQMSDSEMESEIDTTQFLRSQVKGGASPTDVLTVHAQNTPDAPSVERMKGVLASDERLDKHLENVHRQRYLKEMKKVAKTGTAAAQTSGPGASSGSAPSASTPSQPRPITEPGNKSTTTATTINARKARMDGAKQAIINLTKKINDGGLSQDQRAQFARDRRAIDSFGIYLSKHPNVTDPLLIDAAMDDQLTDNQKQYIAGLF